jgi:Iap family predicted aminopeptidase
MPKVIHIKTEDNFRQLASRAIIKKKDYLVIVSLTHKSGFSDFYSNFSQPDFWSDLNGSKNSNVVFVLADIERLESFRIEAKRTISENQLTNIVGIIPGNRHDETIVFSAHYDHLGIGPPINEDSIYNGANDDASGVTAVIELARYFKSKGRPERTLMFIAFTAILPYVPQRA